jgi:hypothetical protein
VYFHWDVLPIIKVIPTQNLDELLIANTPISVDIGLLKQHSVLFETNRIEVSIGLIKLK